MLPCGRPAYPSVTYAVFFDYSLQQSANFVKFFFVSYFLRLYFFFLRPRFFFGRSSDLSIAATSAKALMSNDITAVYTITVIYSSPIVVSELISIPQCAVTVAGSVESIAETSIFNSIVFPSSVFSFTPSIKKGLYFPAGTGLRQ